MFVMTGHVAQFNHANTVRHLFVIYLLIVMTLVKSIRRDESKP